jgi:hypothetical protein
VRPFDKKKKVDKGDGVDRVDKGLTSYPVDELIRDLSEALGGGLLLRCGFLPFASPLKPWRRRAARRSNELRRRVPKQLLEINYGIFLNLNPFFLQELLHFGRRVKMMFTC